MLDLLLLIAFIALPIGAWLASASLTWVTTRLIFAFGVAGAAVQTSISFGGAWNLLGLQLLSAGLMLLVLGLAIARRFSGRERLSRPGGLRRQLLVIVLPALVIGASLILLRLLAPQSPGALTGVGYLISHPIAEDNAKWLNLSSQLASGSDLVFNGYAGVPLIMIMAIMATLISVLSTLLLGGVNEVAVAVNSVIGSQYLLLALVPFAFAPFAERKAPLRPRTADTVARFVPAPLVFAAMGVVLTASAVVTNYGHMSLQFVLIVLVIWSTVFLLGASAPRTRLLATLAIATTASVWLPLNVLGIGLLAGFFVLFAIRRRWLSLVIVIITVLAVWDALISSTLYLFGIDLGGSGATSAGADGAAGVASGATELSPQVVATTQLFEAGGGTEIVQPLVGGLALVSLLLVVSWFSRVRPVTGLRAAAPFAPIVVMGVYVLAISMGDALVTGSAPHYGGHKIAFALVIMTLASCFPLAIVALQPALPGMTLLRWFAIGALVVLLSVDTMLPRALSGLSPTMWKAVDSSAPPYWSPAEVRATGNQAISSLPIACLVGPPEIEVPGALPAGQTSYSCTRLLVGLNGLEGRVGPLTDWLRTDWLSNTFTWKNFYRALNEDADGIAGRQVIVMKRDQSLAGLTSLRSLIDRYPPAAE